MFVFPGDLTVRVLIKPVEEKPGVVEKKFKRKDGSDVNLLREGRVCVEVVDTGVGMTQEQVAKVFVDGTQFNVNQLQAGKGSGLGMYIAKGICKRHGGSLDCWSKGLGHGTTFTMTMPLYRVTVPHVPLQQENSGISEDKEHDTTEAALEHFPLRVLVVDDSSSNLKLLTRLLANRGHNCDGARNGQEALELVREQLDFYDSILMDYEMPVMDGPTACSQMRAIGCSAFIVGISGNIMPEDVAYYKGSGANAVLPKPFKLNLLENLWTEYGVSGRNQTSITTSATTTTESLVEEVGFPPISPANDTSDDKIEDEPRSSMKMSKVNGDVP